MGTQYVIYGQRGSLNDDALAEVGGCVTTCSADGRVRDTRCFHTRGGQAFFSEHISL